MRRFAVAMLCFFSATLSFSLDVFVKRPSYLFEIAEEEDWAKSETEFYSSCVEKSSTALSSVGVRLLEVDEDNVGVDSRPLLDFYIEGVKSREAEFRLKIRGVDGDEKELQFYFSTPNVEDASLFSSKIIAGLCRSFVGGNGKAERAPVFVDSFVPANVFGSPLPASERRAVLQNSVVGLDDFSFVVSEGKTLRKFDVAGNLVSVLSDKITSSRNEIRNYWKVGYDGNDVLYGTPQSRDFYFFDRDGNMRTVEYAHELSASRSIRYGKDGVPFFVDLGSKRVSFPKTDSCVDVELPDSIHNYYVFRAEDGRLWKSVNWLDMNYALVYKEDGAIEDVHFLEDGATFLYSFGDSSYIVKYVDESKKTVLKKFDRRDRLVWTVDVPSSFSDISLSDVRNGVFYFLQPSTDSLVRFASPDAGIPSFMKKLAECNVALYSNPNDSESLLRAAECYDDAGGKWLAYEGYSRYLKKSPGNAKALERKLLAEIALEKGGARKLSDKAFALYDEFGEESAREAYQDAMKTLERLRRLSPNDAEVSSMYTELKSVFSPGSAVSALPSLVVDSVEVAPVFPAKINIYPRTPNGVVYVSNPTKSALRNVKVTAFARKFMDFPSEGETLPELKSGASQVPLMVSTQINSASLSVTEDTTVQMQFTLSWEEDGKSTSMSVVRPVTIYRKSAMDWGDLSMLSCFVLPNDESVSAFVFGNLKDDGSPCLSLNVRKAMQIADALGSIPLNYVSDPVNPAVDQIGNKYAIDTVRFPSETLSKKGGDCDDMTTLFCSALESAGVPCAVVTVPGHIFLAFDSGMKRGAALSMLEAAKKLRFIPDELLPDERKGSLWIPVEATALSSGFYESWMLAGGELFDSKTKECVVEEFVCLEYARADYPPVGFSAKKVNVSSDKKVSASLDSDSSARLKKDALEVFDTFVGLSKSAKELNRVAKLYFSLGEKEKAVAALESAVACDPNYRSSFVNLAALHRSIGNPSKASEYASRAQKIQGKKNDAFAGKGDGSARASSAFSFDWDE